MLSALLLCVASTAPHELTVAFLPDDAAAAIVVVRATSDDSERALSWIVLPRDGAASADTRRERGAVAARALPFPSLPTGSSLVDDGTSLTLTLPPMAGSDACFLPPPATPAKPGKRSEAIPHDGAATMRLSVLGGSDHRALLSDGTRTTSGVALWWSTSPVAAGALLIVRDKAGARAVPVADVTFPTDFPSQPPVPLAVDVAAGQYASGAYSVVGADVRVARVNVASWNASADAKTTDALLLKWPVPPPARP